MASCASVSVDLLQGSCWEAFEKSFKELSPCADVCRMVVTEFNWGSSFSDTSAIPWLLSFLHCFTCQGMGMGIPPNSSFALFFFFMYKYNSDSTVVLLCWPLLQLVLIFAKSEFQSPSLWRKEVLLLFLASLYFRYFVDWKRPQYPVDHQGSW